MSTVSNNALVLLTAKGMQDALMEIHDALLGSEHFTHVYGLSVESTNLVIEDMTVSWVRFRHLWTSAGGFVENYTLRVEDLMEHKISHPTGMPRRVFLGMIWDHWVETLTAFAMGG